MQSHLAGVENMRHENAINNIAGMENAGYENSRKTEYGKREGTKYISS